MNKNRIIAGIAAFITLSSAAGCGSTDTSDAPSETQPAAQTEAETVTEGQTVSETAAPASETETEASEITESEIPPLDTSPVTFTFYTTADNKFEGEIAERITELTGVTLDIVRPSGDNSSKELELLAQSGQLPDLIFAPDDMDMLFSYGSLVQLDEYIDTYGDNIKQLYGDEGVNLLKNDQGKTFTVGTNRTGLYAAEPQGTFQLQYRVLKEAGFPEIKTAEQFESVLADYLEKNPKNPDGSVNTGLLLCGRSAEQWTLTVGGRICYALGFKNDGDYLIDTDKDIITYKWAYEKTREYFRWLNHLYNEGLMDPDSFTLKKNDYLWKISHGNVLALADDPADYAESNGVLCYDGRYDRTYCPLPMTLSDDITENFMQADGSDIGYGIAVSAACSDAVRAFRFLDWYCSEEAQKLVNGSDDISMVYPFPMADITAKDSDGNYIASAMRKNTASEYNTAQKEITEGYGIELLSDMFAPRSSFPPVRHGNVNDYDISETSEAGIISSACDSYIRTEVSNAIKLPEEEFDLKWKEIEDWIEKCGCDRLNDIIGDMAAEESAKRFS